MKRSAIKQHIIETASQLFYKNGYNLTGINEIIAEAGIAKATLYNHFKSKEDICIAYLQHKNHTFLKDIRTFCKEKEGGTAQLLGLFDFLQAFFKDRDFNGCWCIRTVSEIPRENERIRGEIQGQKVGLIGFIRGLLEENIAGLSGEEQDLLSRQLYLLYEGAVAESHLHQSDWPIQSARAMCSKLLN
ncbi:MAG: TetR/AcrR family transcriptional regulator [Bacteroidota bacterium]